MRGQTLILAALALLVSLSSDFGAGSRTALAQQLDAGKPPGQIFSSTCSACHRSPRGLVKNFPGSLPGFLRQHYTTGDEMARAMAAYVLANGGTDRVAEPPPRREPKQKASDTAARTPDAKEQPKSRRQKDSKKGKSEPPEPKQDAAKTDPPAIEDKPDESRASPTPVESAKDDAAAPPAVAAAPAAEAKAPETTPAPIPAPPREPRSTIRLPGFPPPVDDPPEPAPAATATAPSAGDSAPATSPPSAAIPASPGPETTAPVPETTDEKPQPAAALADPSRIETEKQASQSDESPKLDILQEEVHAPPRARTVQQKKRAQ